MLVFARMTFNKILSIVSIKILKYNHKLIKNQKNIQMIIKILLTIHSIDGIMLSDEEVEGEVKVELKTSYQFISLIRG